MIEYVDRTSRIEPSTYMRNNIPPVEMHWHRQAPPLHGTNGSRCHLFWHLDHDLDQVMNIIQKAAVSTFDVYPTNLKERCWSCWMCWSCTGEQIRAINDSSFGNTPDVWSVLAARPSSAMVPDNSSLMQTATEILLLLLRSCGAVCSRGQKMKGPLIDCWN